MQSTNITFGDEENDDIFYFSLVRINNKKIYKEISLRLLDEAKT